MDGLQLMSKLHILWLKFIYFCVHQFSYVTNICSIRIDFIIWKRLKLNNCLNVEDLILFFCLLGHIMKWFMLVQYLCHGFHGYRGNHKVHFLSILLYIQRSIKKDMYYRGNSVLMFYSAHFLQAQGNIKFTIWFWRHSDICKYECKEKRNS